MSAGACSIRCYYWLLYKICFLIHIRCDCSLHWIRVVVDVILNPRLCLLLRLVILLRRLLPTLGTALWLFLAHAVHASPGINVVVYSPI